MFKTIKLNFDNIIIKNISENYDTNDYNLLLEYLKDNKTKLINQILVLNNYNFYFLKTIANYYYQNKLLINIEEDIINKTLNNTYHKHIKCYIYSYFGDKFFKDKDYDNAEIYYIMSIDISNYLTIDSTINLCYLCYINKDFKNAEKLCLFLLKFNFKNKRSIYHNLGCIYYEIKNFDKMIEYCHLAILNDCLKSAKILKKYYENINKNDKLVEIYDLILSNNIYGIINLGNYICNEQNNLKDAIPIIKKAYEIGDLSSLEFLIACLLHNKQFDDAEYYCKIATEKYNLSNGWYLYGLLKGIVTRSLKDSGEYFKKSLELGSILTVFYIIKHNYSKNHYERILTFLNYGLKQNYMYIDFGFCIYYDHIMKNKFQISSTFS